jgi:predicted acyl esterase
MQAYGAHRAVALGWVAWAFALVTAACGADSSGAALTRRDDGPDTDLFRVRESVEQLHVTHAEPEQELELLDADGEVITMGSTDAQGSLIFRQVPAGEGYTVRLAEMPEERVRELSVVSVEDSLPEESFYAEQVLEPGHGYIRTRDGTTLSVFVALPGPPEDGPYPTVVTYSGYDPGRPGAPIAGVPPALCTSIPVLCNAPADQSALIATMLGYASVGVNMRGTGCSGGAYDYFEPLQLLDGYDAVEVVARQSWVKHGKVGMTGLSYPGITQLFVARTQPPSLVAITPMSVLADSASSTLAPGGIYNEGFALRWVQNVLNGAEPYGKGWEMDVVALETTEGESSECEENQRLHGQAVDVAQKALDNPFYTDEVAGPVDATTFVDEIEVPVFLTGQFQDEQTGPHFAALLDKFDNAPVTRFTVTNGVHPDGFAPQTLIEWKAFLDIYVAQEVPTIDPDVVELGPSLFGTVFKEPLAFPPMRFTEHATVEEARAAYEAEPDLRVIFETGADPALANPGAPKGTFEQLYAAWPVPGTEVSRWYLQSDGTLAQERPPTDGGASSFEHDAEAGARTTLAEDVTSSDEVWNPQPRYDYRPLVPGKALAFLGPALTEDMVMIGHGSVDLWVQSTADDADLEVNLTEVRADGMETYVQSGWLRASHRALRDDASELRPIQSHYETDAAPLPAGEWEPLRIELMPFGHVFRAGSHIRLSIDTPGDSRAAWRFILIDHDGTPTHSVAHDAEHPSSVALPLVPSAAVPSPQPPCASLRGQPCRAFVPFSNTPL